ncbi:MAG: Calx-beta domain-containing protein, partial [bacterium]
MPSASWSAALTWVGNGADTDFNTPANWSPAQTPTLADTCTINSTNNRQPSILTTSECGNLTLGTGATLMTLTFSAGNDLTISGNVTIGSNGRIAPQATPTGTFTVGGDWSDNLATTNFTSSNLHLEYVFTGTSKTISTNESFYDMSVPGSYTLNSNLTIANSMDIVGSGTFTQGPNIFTMNGTAFIISGTYNHTCSSTLVINSTLSLENGEHYPAVITNSGSNVTGANPAYIDCDLTLQSGSTVNIGQTLFVSGNWINNGATVNTAAATIIMSGAGKTIGGTTPTTFYNLTIGDSAGDSTTTLLNTTLNNDLIVTVGAAFTVQANRNITVNGDTSIYGAMYLSGTSTFTQEGYNTGIRVEAGGLLSAQGTDSANRVTFTRATSYFDLVINGGIDFNNVNVYYTRSATSGRGFAINSPGGATVNLNNVAINYTEDVNGAVMLYWNSNRTITASGWSFNSATYSGNDVNVEALQGTINFTSFSGNYAGESFDNDNGGVANWTVLVQFALASSSGPESTTPAVLTVILTGPSPQIVRVDYVVTGGTATGGGVDYTLASGTLTFSSGVTSQPINITINNDLIDELDETIQVTLQNPSNAALGSPTVHTYTIIDNDTAGV